MVFEHDFSKKDKKPIGIVNNQPKLVLFTTFHNIWCKLGITGIVLQNLVYNQHKECYCGAGIFRGI